MKTLKDLQTANEIDFETVSVGYQESFDHVVTAEDVDTFAKLTHDFNPLHLDPEYARTVGFSKPVVYGMLSASFISTMIGMLIPGKGALWAKQSLEFISPSFVGDRLTITAEIIQKSLASRTLVLNVLITNQHGQAILKGESQVRVLKKKLKMNENLTNTHGKAVLITGGSRGIGAATAIRLAKEDYFIGINYIQSESEASHCLRQIQANGGDGMLLRADVGVEQETSDMVEAFLQKFGRIDGFVHCASPHPIPVSLEQSTWFEFQRQLDTQLKGAYQVVKKIVPHLIGSGGGSIVFVSSVYADGTPPTQLSAYVSAKAALSAFAKSLAVELGPKGIRVNIVSPGITLTDMTSQVPEKTKLLTKMNTPLRRLGEPEDVAAAIEFLMSPGARHITGETIRVCGGSVML